MNKKRIFFAVWMVVAGIFTMLGVSNQTNANADSTQSGSTLPMHFFYTDSAHSADESTGREMQAIQMQPNSDSTPIILGKSSNWNQYGSSMQLSARYFDPSTETYPQNIPTDYKGWSYIPEQDVDKPAFFMFDETQDIFLTNDGITSMDYPVHFRYTDSKDGGKQYDFWFKYSDPVIPTIKTVDVKDATSISDDVVKDSNFGITTSIPNLKWTVTKLGENGNPDSTVINNQAVGNGQKFTKGKYTVEFSADGYSFNPAKVNLTVSDPAPVIKDVTSKPVTVNEGYKPDEISPSKFGVDSDAKMTIKDGNTDVTANKNSLTAGKTYNVTFEKAGQKISGTTLTVNAKKVDNDSFKYSFGGGSESLMSTDSTAIKPMILNPDLINLTTIQLSGFRNEGNFEVAPDSQDYLKVLSADNNMYSLTDKVKTGTQIHFIFKYNKGGEKDFYFQFGEAAQEIAVADKNPLIKNTDTPSAATFGASTPDGKPVTVWYNGKQVTSPMTEGLYNVTLKADGYKPVDVTLNVARSDGKLFYIYPVNNDGTGQGTVMNPGTESKPNFNTINVNKKDVSNFGMQLQGVPTSIKENYGDASNFEVNANGVVNAKKGVTVKDGQKFAVEYTKNGATETYYFNIKVTDNGKTTPTTGGNSSNSGSTSTSTSTGSTTTTTPVTTPSTNTGSTTTTTNTNGNNTVTTNSGQTVTIGNNIGVEGEAVYAIRPIYLYKKATFKKSQRMAYYPKQKRTNRPMFVVVGYEKVNGKLRYEVKDVNHTKNTANKTGYITANTKYVVPVYYSSVPKSKTITVIAKGGVNSYSSKNLSGKSKHYKKGAHLKVKAIIKHNLTTRYQLTNGKFITANKKLVIQGRY